jgi:mono/diheme cytochrome c family protein
MTKRVWALVCAPMIVSAMVLLMAAANGAWLKKVPASDRAMVNPVAAQPDAIAAGSNLFQNNCAQCHGADGNGRGRRPPVHSARIAGATDGDLYWLLKNGQPFRGMPSWARLPEGQRWQIVAYLRSIQPQPASPDASGEKQ